ncbi:MAG: putative coat protein [Loecwouvirus pseudonemorishabitans]|uniref:Coat protein n=1 Tax=Leviviridae sp. TaxID=2027243 RepID=A0ABY3STA9_9VIRU|nr:MAG: putative coat protein [Leviviridae sp.]UJQ85511.1 MAG: putative coat protein [Leviviridae sp.]
MIGDTITVSYNAGNVVLTKINQDNYGAEYLYKDATLEYRMKVRHSSSVRSGTTYDRHNIELTRTVYGVAPAPNVTQKAYLVVETPATSDPTDAFRTTQCLVDELDETSGALITKLIGWES